MTDIALRYDPASLELDAFIDGIDLATEDGLYSACLVSMFTDRQADEDEVLVGDDRGGWWGDAFADEPGDLIGSLLWTLKRETITSETLRKARDYTQGSLAWLIKDGVAGSIDVVPQRQDPNTIALAVTIARPDGRIHRFDYLWSSIDGV